MTTATATKSEAVRVTADEIDDLESDAFWIRAWLNGALSGENARAQTVEAVESVTALVRTLRERQ